MTGYGEGLYGGGVAHPGVPTLEQVATALAKTPEKVSGAYLAERDAQAKACRIDPYGNDLARALVRRVARAIAAEAMPLGVASAEFGPTYLRSTDPEVRRLEAPYRKSVLG